MRLTFLAVLLVTMVTICHGAPWIADDKENALYEGRDALSEEDRRKFSELVDSNLHNENDFNGLMTRRGLNIFQQLNMDLNQRLRELLEERKRQLMEQMKKRLMARLESLFG